MDLAPDQGLQQAVQDQLQAVQESDSYQAFPLLWYRQVQDQVPDLALVQVDTDPNPDSMDTPYPYVYTAVNPLFGSFTEIKFK